MFFRDQNLTIINVSPTREKKIFVTLQIEIWQ